MASDTVIWYRLAGIVTGCGPSEMMMFTVAPSSAAPVGVHEITSPLGTDELYCDVQVAARPMALSVVVAPVQLCPRSEGMASTGGPADTVTVMVDP